MKLLKNLVFFLCLEIVLAKWQVAKFEADYYHKSTLSQYDKNYSCYYVCNKDEKICAGLPKDCKFIDKPENLVETSASHENKVKIWSKDPLVKIPHFLVIKPDGEMFDYSLDPEKSPPITITAKFPLYGDKCVAFDNANKRVIVRNGHGGERDKFWQWNFDSQDPKELDIKDPDAERPNLRTSCGISRDGASMIIYGADYETKTILLYHEGKFSFPPIDQNIPRRRVCAAFHPSNNQVVYLFGGFKGGNTVDIKSTDTFSYDIVTGQLQDLAAMPHIQLFTSCIGFIDDDKPVSNYKSVASSWNFWCF